MASKKVELALECKRQSENCLYTSTSLLIWLRFLRYVNITFIVVPLVLGAVASWQLVTGSSLESVRIIASTCALFAGLLPTIYYALKIDDRVSESKMLSGEFTNLRDRFRYAALVTSQKAFPEFEEEVRPLLDRLDKARSHSYTAPEPCFWLARQKIGAGHYSFDVDVKQLESQESEPAAVSLSTSHPAVQAGLNPPDKQPT